MQTFLPYANFNKTAKCLDYKRLGKQRVEALQIYKIVSGERTTGGWINHPIVQMWMGYPDALAHYHNTMIDEWIIQGYKNNMKLIPHNPRYKNPEWLGEKEFHDSHKSNLIRKNPTFYSQYKWDVPSNLEYIWKN